MFWGNGQCLCDNINVESGAIFTIMKTSNLTDFGRKARKFRQDAGFSQEHFVGLAGVHRTYIGMAEWRKKILLWAISQNLLRRWVNI